MNITMCLNLNFSCTLLILLSMIDTVLHYNEAVYQITEVSFTQMLEDN